METPAITDRKYWMAMLNTFPTTGGCLCPAECAEKPTGGEKLVCLNRFKGSVARYGILNVFIFPAVG